LRLTIGTLLETQRRLNFKIMPTGYTTDIYNGKEVTFKDFALNCARAFGACIMQRDDPADEKPKIQPEESYHTKALKKLGKFKKPSKKQFETFINRSIADNKKIINKNKVLEKAYAQMIEQAAKWTPPTTEHEALKDFMLKQLVQSKQWDCGVDSYESELVSLSVMTYEDYVERQKQMYIYNCKYHEEHLIKDITLIKQRNKWIEDLYNSL
jgi:hypothetical protein